MQGPTYCGADSVASPHQGAPCFVVPAPVGTTTHPVCNKTESATGVSLLRAEVRGKGLPNLSAGVALPSKNAVQQGWMSQACEHHAGRGLGMVTSMPRAVCQPVAALADVSELTVSVCSHSTPDLAASMTCPRLYSTLSQQHGLGAEGDPGSG